MKHRLLYFLYNDELPLEIDHINGIRDDNRISNLRSVTRQDNLRNINFPKKGRRIFSDDELHTICTLIAEKELSDTKIAKLLNCSRTAINSIKTKHRHKDFSDRYF